MRWPPAKTWLTLAVVGLGIGASLWSGRVHSERGRAAELARLDRAGTAADRAAGAEATAGLSRPARTPEEERRRREAIKQALIAHQLVRADEAKREAEAAQAPPGRNVDEAADWETMSDKDREAIGLTPIGLYGSANGARWQVLGHFLSEKGKGELAAEALAVGEALWSLQQPGGGDRLGVLAREKALLAKLGELPELDDEMRGILDQARTGSGKMERGEEPSVEDKIAVERESALRGENLRQKDSEEEDDAEKKAAERNTRPAASAPIPAP